MNAATGGLAAYQRSRRALLILGNGAWDALLALARELQRLFHRFTEENLKDFPGPEAKTISMGLALASEAHEDLLAAVYQQAGRNLDLAKSAGKDCIYVLGRVLEWKQLGSASVPAIAW